MKPRISSFEISIVLSLPIINTIATITTNYFPASSLNPGTIRAIIIGSFTLFFIFTRYPKNSPNLFLFFYIIFYGFLVFLSTNIQLSGMLFLKFFLGIIMFPIGYYYFNNFYMLKKLLIISIVSLIIFISNIFISNVFKLGTSDYLDESFYFGSGKVNITKTMIILVFTYPLSAFFFKNTKFSKYNNIIYLSGLLVALIGIKRSVLVSFILGIIYYALLKKGKTNLIKIILISTIIIFFIITLFPKYTDIFLRRLEAREERIELSEETLETEARYGETIRVWETWKEGNLKHKLIGSELFNDRFFFKTKRMLHTDYMILLNGSGIIGLFLWFSFLFLIIKKEREYFRYLKNMFFFQELNSIFYILIISQIIMSISSTVYTIDLRGFIFLYWGAILSTMRNNTLVQINQKNK